MIGQRSDLPLDRDALSRFLPWLIAFMVYLAALALAGMLVLHALAGRWDRGMSGILTVQVTPAPDVGDGAAEKRRLDKVLAILNETPGVVHANILDRDRLLALLEPWLGDAGEVGDLPLPRLIDVEIAAGAPFDTAGLSRRLAAAVPGASVDDHGVWLGRLIELIRTVEALASAVLVLIALATVGTVVFTTRTGLAIHQEAIEVLHHIGAHDTYVARQFAGRALTLGLRGGGIGLAFAVPTLLGIGVLTERMEAGLLPEFAFSPAQWASLAVLPLAVAAIAMVTARLTVLRTLSRML